MRAQLEVISNLLDSGGAHSAVEQLRSMWEPDLPADSLVPLYCLWIRALCQTGELQPAITLARRAAHEYPREPDVLVALGNVLDIVGELGEAKEIFLVAVDIEPLSQLANYNLGAVLDRLDDIDAAKKHYEKAIFGDPDAGSMVEAVTALGALFRRQGMMDEAIAIYEHHLDDDPVNIDVLVELGISLSDLDRLDEACERFESALSLDAKHVGALYNLAVTQYRDGQHDKAIDNLRSTYHLDRGNSLTLAVLGSWLLPEDETSEEALTYLYQAFDLIESTSRTGELSPNYGSLVVEEIFEALWLNSRQEEARIIARSAARYDLITPHMLDTLNWVDHGPSARSNTFTVSARAEADISPRPAYWPQDAEGYTTDLTVVASDEDEAKQLTLAYLQGVESAEGVCINVDSVRCVDRTEVDVAPRPRGVIGVAVTRAYFRQ